MTVTRAQVDEAIARVDRLPLGQFRVQAGRLAAALCTRLTGVVLTPDEALVWWQVLGLFIADTTTQAQAAVVSARG